jgi:uncharacterized protein with NRDE domain
VCTLTLAWQVFEDAPVVVAANRDELLDRDSEPPAVRDWERPVVAPQDADAGGTWIGYNDAGVLVSLTNRWTDADPTGERSRGLLVRDALARDTAELDGRGYAGFNLVALDAAAALLVEWGGPGTRRVRNFQPGVHVVVNVGADGSYAVPASRQEAAQRQVENATRLGEVLRPEPGEDSRGWLDRAAGVISDHEYGVCVHGDGFGTRSSSLIRLVADGTRDYEFADGPPCESRYESVEASLPR